MGVLGQSVPKPGICELVLDNVIYPLVAAVYSLYKSYQYAKSHGANLVLVLCSWSSNI